MTELDAIRELLMQDAPQNAALLHVLNFDEAQAVFRHGDAVCIRPTGDHEIMLSSPNEKDLVGLLESLPPKYLAVDTVYLTRYSQYPLIGEYLDDTLRPHPYLQYYAHPEELTPMTCPFPMEPLSAEDAPFVYAHYTRANETDLDYLIERISGGPGYKALAPNGEIAGFILTHDEGALGMLEVLPAYRGNGIGPALEYRIAMEVHRRGQLIYSNVAPDNTNSIRIHQKLGFTRCKDCVVWIDND